MHGILRRRGHAAQVVDFVRPRLAKATKISTIVEEMLDRCVASDPKETQGLGNKSPEVVDAVAELLRLKAILEPPEDAA